MSEDELKAAAERHRTDNYDGCDKDEYWVPRQMMEDRKLLADAYLSPPRRPSDRRHTTHTSRAVSGRGHRRHTRAERPGEKRWDRDSERALPVQCWRD